MNVPRIAKLANILLVVFLCTTASTVPASSGPSQLEDLVSLMPAGRSATHALRAADWLLADIVSIAAGGNHTCAVTAVGDVKCWGNNSSGQLGNTTSLHRHTIVDVIGLPSGVQAVTAGRAHTCALTKGGGVKCWGDNSSGQLGNTTPLHPHTIVDVIGLSSGVRAIVAGSGHTCALTDAGGVKCWGSNSGGQLGDGTLESRSVPDRVSGLDHGVVGITGGDAHTCAWTEDGAAKCWGSNRSGQLGDGTLESRSTPTTVSWPGSAVAGIAAGSTHTCAWDNDGVASCWGHSELGTLGDGAYRYPSNPRPVPGAVLNLAAGVEQIVTGQEFSCALTRDAEVKCWGNNKYGQLGTGSHEDHSSGHSVPAKVTEIVGEVIALGAGESHICAVDRSATVQCWGNNSHGQSNGGTLRSRATPAYVTGLTAEIEQMAAGDSYSCGISSSGEAVCWGARKGAPLFRIPQASIPTGVSSLDGGVTAIAVGSEHACALTDNGGVKCWGGGGMGQIGNGADYAVTTPRDVEGLSTGVVGIAAGSYHTCAVTSVGGVKCWGTNQFGQLGDGTDVLRRLAPVDVQGLQSGITALSAGGARTCALTEQGAVLCWGYDLPTPTAVTDLSGRAVALTVGGGNYYKHHACVVTDSGAVQCWGDNQYGQLGVPGLDTSSKPVNVEGLNSGVVAVSAGQHHTCALMDNGQVQCWGANGYGQLGDGKIRTMRETPAPVHGLAEGAVKIAAGDFHTCAVLAEGSVLCWGWDGDGQLGLGRTVDQRTPIQVGYVTPSLDLNHLSAHPGSILSLSGCFYPIASQMTLHMNDHGLNASILTDELGSILQFLDTSAADEGAYRIHLGSEPAIVATLHLDASQPLYSQEGGGDTLPVPAGIGRTVEAMYLPLLTRVSLLDEVFVSAGEFQMGCDDSNPSETCYGDEKPLHTVYLDDYFIDRYEVTNERYQTCVEAGSCTPPKRTGSYRRDSYYGNPEFVNYPVIYVDWNQAAAFCYWEGKHLPTEAQWEKAARGGQDTRTYPWGDKPPTCKMVNGLLAGDACIDDTTPVGTYPAGASPYGVMDMSGNVWEWVYDLYDHDYYGESPPSNPQGPNSGIGRAVRGGSFISNSIHLRTASRSYEVPTDFYEIGGFFVGFRCARQIAPDSVSD